MGRLKKKTGRNPHTAHHESPDIINLSKVSARRYQDLFNNASHAIFIRDLKGNIIEVNEAAVTLTGYTHNELTRMNISEFLTAESFKLTMERQQALFEDETATQRYELELIRKDGARRNIESVTSLLAYKGTPLGVQCIVTDITERKRMQELQGSKAQYQTTLQSAPFGCYRVGKDGLWWGCKHEGREENRSTGVVAVSAVGFTLLVLLIVLNEILDLPHLLFNFPPTSINWAEMGMEVFLVLVIGVGTIFSLSILDSKRKRVEEELRKFKTISDRAQHGVGIITPDGKLTYVNESFAKMHGYTVEELIGKHYSLLHTEEQMKLVERLTNQLIRTGSSVVEEVWHRKKDGAVFPTWLAGTAMKDDKGKPLYLSATMIDITEQKRLRENMEFYISQITRAQEEERKRVAREIHDDSIQSLATLALDIDAIAKEKERLPEGIIQSLEGLRAKTNSILDGLRRFSHELRPGVIDQIGLVPALEILAEESNKAERVNTSLEIIGSERRLTPEAELALFRIAQEALRNIRRHSVATEATIRLKFTRRKVRLTISDNGRGFELPEMLSDFVADGKLGLVGIQERAPLLPDLNELQTRKRPGALRDDGYWSPFLYETAQSKQMFNCAPVLDYIRLCL